MSTLVVQCACSIFYALLGDTQGPASRHITVEYLITMVDQV